MAEKELITHTYNGETHTVEEWAKVTGLSTSTVRRHIRLGLPMKRIEREHGDYNSDWWKLINSTDTSTVIDKLDDGFDVTDYARRHKYGADE